MRAIFFVTNKQKVACDRLQQPLAGSTKLSGSALVIRGFDFPKIETMSRIIRVLIQNSSHQSKNRLRIERSGIYLISLLLTSSLILLWCKEFWIITLIILLVVYILGKSKHLTGSRQRLHEKSYSVLCFRKH